jgi:hypothetical protein
MKHRERRRRITPSLVISIVALVAAVSGTAVAAQIHGSQLAPKSVGGGKLKPFTGGLIKPKTIHGSKLKQFTGGLIKPESVPAGKIVPDSLGSRQIDESRLGTVPSADRLAGSFSARLAFGESAELAESGPFKLTAQCVQNGTTSDGTEGRDFVRLLISSTEPGAVFTSGVDSLTGSAADQFLGPDTPETDRVVDEIHVETGNANFKSGGSFAAMAPEGKGIGSAEGTTSAAINLFGTGCAVQGTAIANG